MPSREEIVSWLREAAALMRDSRYEEVFDQRAAQAEAMRCETCKHSNPDPIASGMGYCKKRGCSLVDGGDCCFAHEPKEGE